MVPDAELVSQLMAMGFQENGCRRAAVAVNNASAGEFGNLDLFFFWFLRKLLSCVFPPTLERYRSCEGGLGWWDVGCAVLAL